MPNQSESLYPLNNDENELARLFSQSLSHYDSRLDGVVRRSKRILDLGCGPGTLANRISAINPTTQYVGIDSSPTAISRASLQLRELASFKFLEKDFQSVDLSNLGQFDLVLCRLVLWSLPNVSAKFLKRLASSLTPGGVLHAFEPDDSNLVFYPVKAGVSQIVTAWQKKVIANGQDPFIGKKLYSLFVDAGLTDVESHPMLFHANGRQPDRYLAISKNLEKIFAGRGPEFLNLPNSFNWAKAILEFTTVSERDYLVETHYSAFGTSK